MEVTISPAARKFVIDHGGVVYVRTTHSRCCSGTLTMLKATTDQPADAQRFSSSPTNDVDVRYLAAPGSTPDELTIDLKGRRKPRLEAYWDGCLFRL